MVLKSPNMGSCSLKQKCLGGANKGLAYDPLDPCPQNSEFNSITCDCEQVLCYRTVIIEYARTIEGNAGCYIPNCSEGPFIFDTKSVSFPRPMMTSTGTSRSYSAISTQCTEENPSPNLTSYKALFGVDFWYISSWGDAEGLYLDDKSGISDGVYYVATSNDNLLYGFWVTLGWTGAVGCTFSSAYMVSDTWIIPEAC